MKNLENNVYKIDWTKTKTPIEVSSAEYKILDGNYLFNDQVEKMVKLCNEHIANLPVITAQDKYAELNGNICSDSTTQFDSNIETRNNNLTISIVGDRGSGKSSLMATTRNVIGGRNDIGVYLMSIIDPNVFGDSLSLIELVVSNIFEETRKLYKNTKDTSEKGNKDFNQIIVQLKEIIKIIADLKSCKSKFYEGNPNTEILTGINERVKFKAKIKDLFTMFLEYVNFMNINKDCKFKKIAIFIDDIDMVSNKVVYEMLEDIRQYFSENAIIFLSFKYEELYSVILQNKVIENNLLLKNDLITMHQIHEKTARYIEKVVPVTLHVFLPSKIDLYKTDYFGIIKNLVARPVRLAMDNKQLEVNEENNMNIKKWIDKKILDKTQLQISPIDSIEDVEYIYPTNLRGLLQLLETIDGMIDVKYLVTESELKSKEVEQNKRQITKDLLANIEIYDNYLRGYSQTLLSAEDIRFLQEWENTQLINKNHFACFTLENRISKYHKENSTQEYIIQKFMNTIVYEEMQVYNVAISDVYTMIEEYKKILSKDVKDFYFIYMVKIKYSIELIRNYLKAVEFNFSKKDKGQENNFLLSYLQLVNCKIMPENFTYLSRIKKEEFSIRLKKYESDWYKQLVEKLIYSPVSKSGDFRRTILKQKHVSTKLDNEGLFHYRNLYDYELNCSDLKIGSNYYIDPLSLIGKKKYVEESFVTMKYIFISLFDIDVLIRLRYGREGMDSLIYKITIALRKTPDINKANVKNYNYKRNEKEWIRKLSNCIFINAGSTKAIYYTEREIEFILIICSNSTTEIQLDNKETDKSEYKSSVDLLKKSINKMEKNKNKITIRAEFFSFYEAYSAISDKLVMEEETDDREMLHSYYERIKIKNERMTKAIRDGIYMIIKNIVKLNHLETK